MSARPRTRLALSAVALTLVAVVAACGSSSDDEVASPTSSTGSSATFAPVTLTHEYGTTTVSTRPERVVTVGYTDQDAVLALGVVPVGIRDWYGDQPDAVWPWARTALGSAKPTVLSSSEIDVEAVAALTPDLILGVSSGMTEQEYADLSRIAPTLPQPAGVAFGTTWQDQTTLIGTALGKGDEAARLVSDVEERFTDAKAEHPEFVGKTAVFGSVLNGSVYAYAPTDVRGRLLTSLGFTIPASVVSAAGDAFYATISLEKIDLLDVDALVWIATDAGQLAAAKATPLYRSLAVSTDGGDIDLTDPTLVGAASFSSVLSLPSVLDALVPRLAAAVDKDPATVTS